MSLFGYFSLGLQSMSAARLGLQVAGDNIANVLTPGYARRRLELTPGMPVQVPGGLIDQGVEVAGLRRMEDRFLEATLRREHGGLAGHGERLRGLRLVESTFGPIEGEGTIAASLAEFGAAFSELAAQPSGTAERRGAITAADGLARSIRDAYGRLTEQRQTEDQAAGAFVARVDELASELASLNREIAAEEAGGGVAAPLLDQRGLVIEELVELTGGSAVAGAAGRVGFSLPGGPTLVTGDEALGLGTVRDVDGTLRVLAGADGSDITDRLRGGRLGAVLYLRDEVLAGRRADLDTLAADVIARANAVTAGAFDLAGNPGASLFEPDPPVNPGVAGTVAVNPDLLEDPTLLAISASGAPGDGAGALALADLPRSASAALGGRSATDFLVDLLGALGSDVASEDVSEAVSRSHVESLTARRDSIVGVSLDEEAVALIQNQRAFEAAARFIDVLSTVTEVAVNLARR